MCKARGNHHIKFVKKEENICKQFKMIKIFFHRYPWGEEAFRKAREENKPIFLSVGYSTCHWCHVMEHESFENVEIGQLLNDHFVSIKVDREERPDVDKVYMTFVQVGNVLSVLSFD